MPDRYRSIDPPRPRRTAGRSAPGDTAGRAAAFERLGATIRRCRRCPLGATRTHAVVYRGSFPADVLFVGEAPGAEEDRRGVPFVGRSGQILDRAIERLGPVVGRYGVLNVLKCRPPANRFDPSAAATCRPYLERQVDLLRPRLIVTLGARALMALAPDAPPVLRSAGTVRSAAVGRLFPLLHPAATLRSRTMAERWEADLERLRTELERSSRETA